ncbi:MAG: hypothetical protein LBN23_05755, partial [Paludibacter sp.]|nr:hypothetical protein [Paludibacter sp.]
MKNSGKYLIVMAIAIWLMSACNTVKYVPENEYLLKSSRIQTDITDIPKDELNTYLRQQPNLKVFGVLPLALNVYNCAYKDTLSGWIWWKKTFNKAAQRLGNEPIIYSESLTRLSAQQLQKLLSNRGYINAQVRTNVNLNNRRADVKYIITGNKPYLLENYEITPQNDVLREVAADTSRTLIHKNMLFDSDVLNEERTRIARELTERGFYNFDKEYLMFVADSAGNKVNLRLDLRRYLRQNPDSTNRTVFRRYTIGNIYFHIHRNSSLTDDADEDTQHADTASANGFYLIQSGKKFISLNALMHNTYINPNSAYNSTNVERTYTALNALGAVKYVNISFVHREDSILDCNIVISPAKTFSTSVELEGTFLESEKYLGGAFRIGAINKNAFKGAEALSFQFRAALELQKNPFGQSTEKGLWAQEYGLQIGLNVPRFMLPLASYNFRRQVQANTEFTLNGSRQMRPAEFNAINISAGMKYVWNKQSFRHAFELFNMSFMGFEIAPEFYFKYLETGEYNIYNYEDRFILRMGYSGSYSAFNTNRPLKNYSTFRYSIETAGNLFYVANWILGLSKSKDDNYQILKIPFSQYIRSDFNVSYNQIFDKNNRFVYHFGMGLG